MDTDCKPVLSLRISEQSSLKSKTLSCYCIIEAIVLTNSSVLAYNKNKMEDLKFEMLISFIRGEIGEFHLEIKKDTLIEDELGVTGDDGIELICNYSKQFNVDITDFKFDKYFYPEPGIFNALKKTISPIRINDLYNGMINGKLL